jgi:hypothetical protein
MEIYFNNVLNMMSEYIKTNYYNQNVHKSTSTKKNQTNKQTKRLKSKQYS